MSNFPKNLKQTRKKLLFQKRFALVSMLILACSAILSLLLVVLGGIIENREWINQGLTLVGLSVPLLLFNFMSALHAEFKGWKLVNCINTQAERATFAEFRANKGLNRTLCFGQCGFKRGEE